jgi:hypothetical protein
LGTTKTQFFGFFFRLPPRVKALPLTPLFLLYTPAMSDLLEYALDLMRRLPPSNVENNLAGLCDLVPDIIEDLLGAVDQPIRIANDKSSRRDYLLSDFNRDGDSYVRLASVYPALAMCQNANSPQIICEWGAIFWGQNGGTP